MSKQRIKSTPVVILAILVLAFVVIYSGFHLIDAVLPSDDDPVPATSSKTIVRDGVEYYPRQDITVFMLMGIDRTGPVEASQSYNNTGEADMVMLAVFDETDKSYSLVLLNRDTMMDVPILGVGGRPAGSAYEQLALAHTYGSGLEDSCENTRKAVSEFLGGLTVDYYMSMNMDAIAILNDAVGGVRVTVTDDFSAVDPSIPMGETVLTGAQAVSFVQTRKDLGDQMNVSRMERQKEYMDGFADALRETMQSSDSFVLKTYDSIADYVVTDCSVNTLNNLMSRYAEYSLKEVVSPEGENAKGDTYMEFRVDEDALDALVLRLFYSKKK